MAFLLRWYVSSHWTWGIFLVAWSFLACSWYTDHHLWWSRFANIPSIFYVAFHFSKEKCMRGTFIRYPFLLAIFHMNWGQQKNWNVSCSVPSIITQCCLVIPIYSLTSNLVLNRSWYCSFFNLCWWKPYNPYSWSYTIAYIYWSLVWANIFSINFSRVSGLYD